MTTSDPAPEVPQGGTSGASPGGMAAWRPRALLAQLSRRRALRSLAANAGWLVADRVVRLGVGLIVNVWIARYLGPARFGMFNYALAIATMFSFASTLGLPDILVRDLIGHPDRRRKILASAFLLRVGGGATVLLLCMGFIVATRPGDPTTWLIMGLLASAQIAQAMDVVDSDYQARGNVRRIVVLRNINFLVFSVLKVAAILTKSGVVAFAFLYTLELAVVAGLMYAAARTDRQAFTLPDATIAEMRRLLREVAPQIARLAIMGIYMRADALLIGRMLGDAELGIYTAATRLIEAWYLIITAAMLAVTPRLAHTFHFDHHRYDAQLKLVVRAVTWSSVAVALGLTVVSPIIVHLLYGTAFAAAAPVLAIHGWAAVLSSLGQTVNGALVNRRQLRFGVYQAIAGSTVNVVACLLLIPIYGLIGGALAAVLTQLATGLLLNGVFRETRPLLWLQLRALTFR